MDLHFMFITVPILHLIPHSFMPQLLVSLLVVAVAVVPEEQAIQILQDVVLAVVVLLVQIKVKKVVAPYVVRQDVPALKLPEELVVTYPLKVDVIRGVVYHQDVIVEEREGADSYSGVVEEIEKVEEMLRVGDVMEEQEQMIVGPMQIRTVITSTITE